MARVWLALAAWLLLAAACSSVYDELGDTSCLDEYLEEAGMGMRPPKRLLSEDFLSAIAPSFEVVSGETVQMELKLRNVTDRKVPYGLGYSPSHSFFVMTPDCELVWPRPGMRLLPIWEGELGVGEEPEVHRRVGAGEPRWRAGSPRRLHGVRHSGNI